MVDAVLWDEGLILWSLDVTYDVLGDDTTIVERTPTPVAIDPPAVRPIDWRRLAILAHVGVIYLPQSYDLNLARDDVTTCEAPPLRAVRRKLVGLANTLAGDEPEAT